MVTLPGPKPHTPPLPGTAEWASKVTASKVAAILGLSPWESPYAIWHLMAGNIPPAEQNRHMQRGNMLENAVLDWWLIDHPEVTEVARQRWYPLEGWAGATPDMDVTGPSGDLELVDAKTISTDEAWADEPPVHYLASSMWQLACAPEAKRVHLAVLFGRPFDLRTYTIERDDDLIAQIVAQCSTFYDTVRTGDMPDLDDTVATFNAVKAMHPLVDDTDVEISPTMAVDLASWQHQWKSCEAPLRAAKSAVMEAMGNARYATCNGVRVARRQPDGPDRTKFIVVAKPGDLPVEEPA